MVKFYSYRILHPIVYPLSFQLSFVSYLSFFLSVCLSGGPSLQLTVLATRKHTRLKTFKNSVHGPALLRHKEAMQGIGLKAPTLIGKAIWMALSNADEATFVLHTSLSTEMLMRTQALGDKKGSHKQAY